jgi:hypothetical protein
MESNMNPAPMPEWCREGETWRIEEERHLIPGTGYCTARSEQYGHFPCAHRAVAVGRSNHALALCAQHLMEMSIWLEGPTIDANGRTTTASRVVSWRLSR